MRGFAWAATGPDFLRESGGNRDLAARKLGISCSTIYERIRRHGLGQDAKASSVAPAATGG